MAVLDYGVYSSSEPLALGVLAEVVVANGLHGPGRLVAADDRRVWSISAADGVGQVHVPAPGLILAADGAMEAVFDKKQPDWSTSESPGCVLVLTFAAPEDQLDQLDRFYAEEHVPILLGCVGWRRSVVHRVTETRSGPAWNRIVVHHLDRASRLTDPAVAQAREAPLMRDLMSHGWFAEPERMVLHCLPG